MNKGNSTNRAVRTTKQRGWQKMGRFAPFPRRQLGPHRRHRPDSWAWRYEFPDEVELELHGNPGGKLEGDVLVGVGSTGATGSGDRANGTRRIDPSFGRGDEVVQTGLLFNPVEFDGIKTGIVELLPNARKLNGVPVPEPVGDEIVRAFGVLEAGDVGETNEILLALRKHRD
jgi:hypothetical protein